MKVVIKDNNGKTVFDDDVKTLFSGFFELWLPRNNKYKVNVEYKNKKSESNISTFDNSKTCITTFRLK